MAKRRIYPRPLKPLAEKAGVSVWTLYKDEARGEPTIDTAKLVAKALGIDYRTLFSEPSHSYPLAS